jgi:methyl-accepting chemotaxis protein
MTEILSIDGRKIDQVLDDIAKLILRLSKSSKKSKKDERLIRQITEIRNQIWDIVLQARLKKSLSVKN